MARTTEHIEELLTAVADEVVLRVMALVRPLVREQILSEVAAWEMLAEKRGAQRPGSAPAQPTGPRRVGIAEVETRLGAERSTIYRWYRSGKFPAPHYIGVRRVWWLHEIIAWEETASPRRRPSSNFNT